MLFEQGVVIKYSNTFVFYSLILSNVPAIKKKNPISMYLNRHCLNIMFHRDNVP